MDSIQTVAGIETPAEEKAVWQEQEAKVWAADQIEAETDELETAALALDQAEAAPGEPDGEAPAPDQAAAEASELEIETLVVEQAEAETPDLDQAPVAEGEFDTEDQAADKASVSEMGDMPMAEWDYQRPKRGEIRSGVILSIAPQEIIVDVGGKRDGIVPYSDIQRLGEEEVAALSVGDQVLVYVLRTEDQDGNLLLSLNMARQEKAWRRAQKMADSGEVWESEVIGYNKGGLVVPIDDIRGFVPASQVPGFPQGLGQEERLQRLADMVGETLQVKVIEINRRKRRLILSATSALRLWRKQQRDRLLEELREGEVRTGTVSSLCSFGAFVDLGGADGLVHLSELSWKRVRHPKEVLRIGAEVDVYVLRLDNEKGRIGLSLKRLQPEPWALVEDKYELGQLVEGVVTNVVDFGAFAELEEGVEGLIHVSELADLQVAHPKDVVKKGDLLLLRIIRIDVRRKRLGLSLKRVLESEWAEWAARLAVEQAESQGAIDQEAESLPEAAVENKVVEPDAQVLEVADGGADAEDLPEARAQAVGEPEAALVEEPAVAEEPLQPEEPDLPDTAEEPLQPEEPALPDTAEEPLQPEEPDLPGAAEEPLQPEEPDLPDTAEEPLQPEEPDLPGAAEEPLQPEEPDLPDAAEEPLQPEELDLPDEAAEQVYMTGSGTSQA